MKYKHVKRSKVFSNKHIEVHEEELILPNGNRVKWTFLKDYHAVGIVAITPAKKIVLVKQYRPAIKKELIELPAGLVDPGEEPMAAALRELEEETGYRAGKINKICEYFNSPGISGSKMYIYIAEDLIMKNQNLDENEFLEVIEIDIEEIDGILECTLDGKTNFALNYIKSNWKKY
ncbi:MAG: NUDIX hydrolase [Psychrilyobacter sp.]|nr:NUDIX hydrolase [Psychrilyobacter sp.]